MLFTKGIRKLDKSNSFKDEQELNILFILVTKEVSKLVKIKEVNFEQPLNIDSIVLQAHV